jgi:hypothetical protein
MKALSINQPWAWLIVNRYKPVENRDWYTHFRGEFLIHAGKKFDEEAYWYIEDKFPEIPLPPQEQFAAIMGGIVGKARLINVINERERHLLTAKDKPWFFGSYGFILDEQEPMELKQCKGALGFFTPDYNSRYVEKQPKPQKKKPISNQGAFL